MFRLMNPKASSGTPPKVGARPLYFNTAVVARFMRTYYGVDAAAEAQRHVAAYLNAGEGELAEIWKRVLAHLCGIEIKEDSRRTVRVAKPLTVRA